MTRTMLLTLALATAMATPTLAQRGNQSQQQAPPDKRFELNGKIHSYDAKFINVVAEDNRPWRIEVPEGSAVSVRGIANADALISKLGVRFEASLDERGVATEPVAKITVFSVRKFFKPMIETLADEDGDAGANDSSNAEVQPGAEETEVDDSPAARRRRRRQQSRQRRESPAQRVHVSGILKSFHRRKGQLVVDVGDAGTVRAQLDPNVVVQVDMTSHAYARAGDDIHVVGTYTPWEEVAEVPEGIIREATARKTDITLAAPQAEGEQPNERQSAPRS